MTAFACVFLCPEVPLMSEDEATDERREDQTRVRNYGITASRFSLSLFPSLAASFRTR